MTKIVIKIIDEGKEKQLIMKHPIYIYIIEYHMYTR